jgi:hypothetical protein
MPNVKFISLDKSQDGKTKYMISFFNEETSRINTIKFGSAVNKDYTIYYKEDGKEKAEQMKAAYIARHKVRENFEDYTSRGSLSRYILWNLPTVEASLKDYLKRFKIKNV